MAEVDDPSKPETLEFLQMLWSITPVGKCPASSFSLPMSSV